MQTIIEKIIARQPFEREQLSTDPADWVVEIEVDAIEIGMPVEYLAQMVADRLAAE